VPANIPVPPRMAPQMIRKEVIGSMHALGRRRAGGGGRAGGGAPGRLPRRQRRGAVPQARA
jgi:hypothetical protein